MVTGVASAVGRMRRARFTSRLSVDVVVVLGIALLVGILASSAVVTHWVPDDRTRDILTLVAAAIGAGAAILAFVTARILTDPRPAWLSAALTMYCIVVLPWTVTAFVGDATPGMRLSRLVAYATALLLLALALRPPRRLGMWGGWLILLAGGLLAVAALRLVRWDGPVAAVVASTVASVVVLVGWVAVAVLYIVDAVRRQSTPRARIGLGLVVLAAGQLYRMAGTGQDDLVFPALRVVGLVVVLVGLLQLVQRGLRELQAQNYEQQEELSEAALHMEKAMSMAAERNHELRNGLAGLAGVTHLLSAESDGRDDETHIRLRHAVLAELSRLHKILDGSVDPADGLAQNPADPPAGDYLVEPMLDGLVRLRRARGAEVTLQVEDGLRAQGDPAVIAQVVTNLLANCERHAPGAPVAVRAAVTDEGTVRIEVRDHGPGLPAGAERDVLRRGVRAADAGGEGLGLHISAQLLESQRGSLVLRSEVDPSGCVAIITLPAVDVTRPVSDSLTR
ncbi:MAG: HAMP domain-containing histidine kinase [Pseudonocardia sp.]|nr:HAMP domain-containing histidine kinase [Pseudonocardia sp.]